MIITTTDFVENAKITKMKDIIFSEQVISVNVAKDFMSGIKGIFGKKLDSYSSEYKKAREEAINDLINQAEKLDVNAIINLKTYYNQFVNSGVIFIVVMAYGMTANIERI